MAKKRWYRRALKQIKHGAVSIFVCAVVVLPLLFPAAVWGKTQYEKSSRKATPLPVFVIRPQDRNPNPPQLFKEPLVTVSFDDGWGTVYTNAMPVLQRDGIHTTQYLLTGTENNPQYLSWGQIDQIQKAGHEIACHTITHPDLTTLSDAELKHQLTGCEQTLSKRYGYSIPDFASPYGSTNPHVINEIQKVYQSHRNSNGDLSNGVTDADVNVAGEFDRYNVIGVAMRANTSVDQLKQAINYTEAHNGWLVIVYHQVDDPAEKFASSNESIKAQLDYLSSTPVRIVTVQQALNGYHQ